MWRMKRLFVIALLLLVAGSSSSSSDYPIKFQLRLSSDLAKHAAADSGDLVIDAHDARALFAGDSISTAWARAQRQRDVAVSGTTIEMVARRFASEIQKGAPAYAHLLAGTNDFYLAGAGGPDTSKMLANVDLALDAARKRHIQVIVGTVLPMDIGRSQNAYLIPAYNTLLVQHVGRRAVIADYYSAMVLPTGAQNSALFYDGIHPNAAGYSVMNQVLDQAVEKTKQRQAKRSEHRHHRERRG